MIDLDRLRERLSRRTPSSITQGVKRRAAVAAVLRGIGADLEVLLIRRAEREGDRWSGQMALPGGQEEPGDRDLFATAVRETREEVGLELTAAELLGRLDEIMAGARVPTGVSVSPFVFQLAERAVVLSPNPEVAEAIWAPLGPLLDGSLATVFELPLEGVTYQLPAYDVGGRIVWGLTHRMLEALFAELR